MGEAEEGFQICRQRVLGTRRARTTTHRESVGIGLVSSTTVGFAMR